jgi:hypothetical protein
LSAKVLEVGLVELRAAEGYAGLSIQESSTRGPGTTLSGVRAEFGKKFCRQICKFPSSHCDYAQLSQSMPAHPFAPLFRLIVDIDERSPVYPPLSKHRRSQIWAALDRGGRPFLRLSCGSGHPTPYG